MEKTIGQTLKELRKIKGAKLREIEKETGISNAYLSQLENDKIKRPSANVLQKLSIYYGIDAKYLFGISSSHIGYPPKQTKNLINYTTTNTLGIETKYEFKRD